MLKTDPIIARKLRTYLEGNEEIVWAGRPQQGLKLRKIDLYNIPFTLAYCGFIGYTGLWRFPPVFFLLFYLLVGRLFYDSMRRSVSYYGITSERVLIKKGMLITTFQEIRLKNIPELSYKLTGKTRGDLYFDGGVYKKSSIEGWNLSFPAPRYFEAIENVEEIHQLILELQNTQDKP